MGKYDPSKYKAGIAGSDGSLKLIDGKFYKLQKKNGKFYTQYGATFQGEYHGEWFEDGIHTGKYDPSKGKAGNGGGGGGGGGSEIPGSFVEGKPNPSFTGMFNGHYYKNGVFMGDQSSTVNGNGGSGKKSSKYKRWVLQS